LFLQRGAYSSEGFRNASLKGRGFSRAGHGPGKCGL
jgi:hypothetical protein